MVHSCCIVGCSNRQNKENGISLHRFPKGPLWRREAWTKAVKRLKLGSTINKQEKWEPTISSRICSIHFLSGRPSEDPAHPDFVPTQNLTGCSNGKKQTPSIERFKRSKKRQSTAQQPKVQTIMSDLTDVQMQDAAIALLDLSTQEEPQKISTGSQCDPPVETLEIDKLNKKLCDRDRHVKKLQTKVKKTRRKNNNTIIICFDYD